MTTKDKILELLDATDRQGIDEVMEWLRGSAFFLAPASTNFHGNYEGGLADHSLNVYTAAMRLRATALSLNPALEADLPEDSMPSPPSASSTPSRDAMWASSAMSRNSRKASPPRSKSTNPPAPTPATSKSSPNNPPPNHWFAPDRHEIAVFHHPMGTAVSRYCSFLKHRK